MFDRRVGPRARISSGVSNDRRRVGVGGRSAVASRGGARWTVLDPSVGRSRGPAAGDGSRIARRRPVGSEDSHAALGAGPRRRRAAVGQHRRRCSSTRRSGAFSTRSRTTRRSPSIACVSSPRRSTPRRCARPIGSRTSCSRRCRTTCARRSRRSRRSRRARRCRATSSAAAIEEQADRLTRLVSDLLDLSRLKGGGFAANPELNTAEDLIGAAVRQTRGLFGDRPLRTVIDLDSPALVGHFDFSQSLRVLCNLLENAVRYSPESQAVELGGAARRRHARVHRVRSRTGRSDEDVRVGSSSRSIAPRPRRRTPAAPASVSRSRARSPRFRADRCEYARAAGRRQRLLAAAARDRASRGRARAVGVIR